MAFHPYLNFAGNCREAFTRYQEIFGGELFLMPMSDMPAEAGDVPAEQAGLLAHAALMIDGSFLMASDSPGGDLGTVQGMYVNFTTSDAAEAERVWAALSDGGQVETPLAETFFAARFGICKDRFGTPWMVNAEPAADAS